MDFDEVIDRRGTHSSKWDTMEDLYGVSPDNGLSMWVADMDFRAPKIIQEKLHGINSMVSTDTMEITKNIIILLNGG